MNSGQIRILRCDNKILVQESTPKNEILVRKFKNPDDAKKFVEKRLKIYEKMWDGYGFKIDYFSVEEFSHRDFTKKSAKVKGIGYKV